VTDPPHEPDAMSLLGLPDSAKQDHRITKKLLAEQFEERSPADARLIGKCLASARLVAILRPETIQVPRYVDDERTVTDIPVIDAALTDKTTAGDRTRVAELIHRSMARPVILLARMPDETTQLSLALSHVSRADPTHSTSVIDAHLMVATTQIEPGAIRIGRLDRKDMWALYRDLVRVAAAGGRPRGVALQASEAVALRRRLIDLEAELASVVRSARQAKGQQARIELNTSARTLRTQISQAREALYRT
jgi:Domain of unknown function (DUF4391)